MLNEDELMGSLQAAASDEFEVIGFLGRREPNEYVFLGRELSSDDLVALQLESEGVDEWGRPAFTVDVVRKLGSSIPDAGSLCSRCQSRLRRWARFCTQCGQDVSGVSASSGSAHSRVTLLSAVRNAAGGDYEVLGDMQRAEGGGLVYFAREKDSGKIVSLRLDQEGNEDYALSVTRVLKPLPRPPVKPVASPQQISIVRKLTTEERSLLENSRRIMDAQLRGYAPTAPRPVATPLPVQPSAPPRSATPRPATPPPVQTWQQSTPSTPYAAQETRRQIGGAASQLPVERRGPSLIDRLLRETRLQVMAFLGLLFVIVVLVVLVTS